MIGRIGAGALETWCAQAGITANRSLQDETGWDFLLQLSASDENPPGPLDRVPPGLTCMVQVKTTIGSDSSESIKLSNWRRMCNEPMPWFVLAVQVDPATMQPTTAHLVHIDKEWCAAVLKRLRELSAEADVALHARYMNVSWGEADRLESLHGRGLKQVLRKHVPSQRDYVDEKVRWFTELGYEEDSARRVSVNVRGESSAEVFENLAGIAVGTTAHFLPGWSATVSDVRFGIEAKLTEFGAEAGEMEFRPPPQGEVELQFDAASGATWKQTFQVFRARAVFPFLPEAFDTVRLASEDVSVVVTPRIRDAERLLSPNVSISIPAGPIPLARLRSVVAVTLLLTGNEVDPVTIAATSGDITVELLAGALGPIPDELKELAENLKTAISVCDAFDVPADAMVSAGALSAQAKLAAFMNGILSSSEEGPLIAPYPEPVGIGEMFGAVHEAPLELVDRTLGLFVGAYGVVTDCVKRPPGGAMVRAATSKAITRKCVVSPGVAESDVDACRTAIEQELKDAGCKHILLPSVHRALVEGTHEASAQ